MFFFYFPPTFLSLYSPFFPAEQRAIRQIEIVRALPIQYVIKDTKLQPLVVLKDQEKNNFGLETIQNFGHWFLLTSILYLSYL